MTKPSSPVAVSKEQYFAAPQNARYVRDIGSTRVYFVDTKVVSAQPSKIARRAA